MEFKEFCAKVRKTHDDYVSRVTRWIFIYPLAFFLTRYTKITPNQITILSILPGILSLIFLTLGNQYTNIIGAFMVLLYAILDGLDGIVSRATGQYSKLGQWLDGVIGYVLTPLMFISTAVGVGSYQALLVGSIASLCFPIQFTLIHYFKSEIVESKERISISSSKKFDFLKYLYGIAPFYYMLILGAFLNKTLYVLYFWAVFGNLFWMIMLIFQYRILTKGKVLDKREGA